MFKKTLSLYRLAVNQGYCRINRHPIDTIQKLAPRDNILMPYFQTHSVPVKDGKLVLFPGWVRHYTRSNMTKENRIITSFDIGAKVEYLSKNN